MGLLGKLARRGGAFMRGAGNAGDAAMAMNAPLGNAAIGGGLGAIGGAGVDNENPLRGALVGGAIGAGGLGGIQALRTGASALKGGIGEMLRMVPYEGPGFEAAKSQITEQIAGEMGGSQVVRNALNQARNADELSYILERIYMPTGEIGAEGQQMAQLGGYTKRFGDML